MTRLAYPTGRDETAGSWPENVPVSDAEFAWFAYAGYKAISEVGGAYALESSMSIGGSYTWDYRCPFSITGGDTVAHIPFTIGAYRDTTFNGPTSFVGSVTIQSSSQLIVQAPTTLTGATTFNSGDVEITGGSIGTHQIFRTHQYVDFITLGKFSALGALNQIGTASSDTLAVYATTTFSAPATFNDTATLSSKTELFGKIRNKYEFITATNTTIAATSRYVFCDIVTSGIVKLPDVANVYDGQIFEVSNRTPSTTVTVQNFVGTIVALLTIGATGIATAKIMYTTSGGWTVFSTNS